MQGFLLCYKGRKNQVCGLMSSEDGQSYLIVSVFSMKPGHYMGFTTERDRVIVFSKSSEIQFQEIRVKFLVETISCLFRYFSFFLSFSWP